MVGGIFGVIVGGIFGVIVGGIFGVIVGGIFGVIVGGIFGVIVGGIFGVIVGVNPWYPSIGNLRKSLETTSVEMKLPRIPKLPTEKEVDYFMKKRYNNDNRRQKEWIMNKNDPRYKEIYEKLKQEMRELRAEEARARANANK
ncbi:unnamed protein product [Orchesella dallaii]|uniref:Uncharacterized protein n=1 Tax=Orchesella dallaii TaxID=48710 RepID=A0ABP1PWG0_9HEXA